MPELEPSSGLMGLGHLRSIRTDQLTFYRDLQARFGDVVRLRLGPYRNWLLFHPTEIETVLTHRADSFVRFEPLMRVLAQWNGASLLVSEGDRWLGRRRRVLPAFATRRMAAYGHRSVALAVALRERWAREAAGAPLLLDTDREMAALTLDIAADTLFGESLGARASEIGDAVAVLSDVAFRESTSPLASVRWLPLPTSSRKRAAMRTIDAFVKGIVAARLSSPADDRGDLLSMLVETCSGDPQAIRDEAVTLLIAGHETNGATLSWASWLLATHPAVLTEVHAEIDQVGGGEPLSSEALRRTPRLRAVIDETLRLYPPAYALFPRRAIETVALGDKLVRRGDLVTIVPFVTQRDGRWFDEPNAFLPGRFDDMTWPRYAYIPFGAGPRVCIGQNFGLQATALALATLLQGFSPQPPDDQIVVDPKFSLRPKGGLRQRWRPR